MNENFIEVDEGPAPGWPRENHTPSPVARNSLHPDRRTNLVLRARVIQPRPTASAVRRSQGQDLSGNALADISIHHRRGGGGGDGDAGSRESVSPQLRQGPVGRLFFPASTHVRRDRVLFRARQNQCVFGFRAGG